MPKRPRGDYGGDALQAKGGLWPAKLGRGSFGNESQVPAFSQVLSFTADVPGTQGRVPGCGGLRLLRLARNRSAAGVAAGLTLSAEHAGPPLLNFSSECGDAVAEDFLASLEDETTVMMSKLRLRRPGPGVARPAQSKTD